MLFFNAPARTDIAELGMDLLILYIHLSTEAKDQGVKMWGRVRSTTLFNTYASGVFPSAEPRSFLVLL